MADDDTGTTPPAAPAADPAPPTDGLGEPGKKALDEERKARRAAERERDAQAARLKEFEDRDKTDAQKLEERASRAEQQLQPLTDETNRLRFALSKAASLDPAQVKPFLGIVDRLRGSTDEELSADADALLALLGNSGPATPPPPPSFDGGVRPTSPVRGSVNSGAELFKQRHKTSTSP